MKKQEENMSNKKRMCKKVAQKPNLELGLLVCSVDF